MLKIYRNINVRDDKNYFSVLNLTFQTENNETVLNHSMNENHFDLHVKKRTFFFDGAK